MAMRLIVILTNIMYTEKRRDVWMMAEFWFLCTAVFHTSLYVYTKFYQSISNSLEDMPWTNCVRTYGCIITISTSLLADDNINTLPPKRLHSKPSWISSLVARNKGTISKMFLYASIVLSNATFMEITNSIGQFRSSRALTRIYMCVPKPHLLPAQWKWSYLGSLHLKTSN